MQPNEGIQPNDEVMYDRADALDNGDFYCIETYSGYYGSFRDPKGVQHLLAPQASDEELGNAVLDALSHSRIVTPAQAPDLYPGRDERARWYQDWIAHLMQKYGYATKRALFKKMKSCSIQRRKGGMISFFPMDHNKLETWEPLEGAEVTLADGSAPEQVGAALRLAFSRCII
jgi:hypothetical protein